MKEKEKVEESTKEEVVKEEVKVENTSKVESANLDSTNKELEELRKFKQDVEAQRKVETEKPKEVNVSASFFSKNEKVSASPQNSNLEKEWEKLF